VKYPYSITSLNKLDTCHRFLKRLAMAAAEYMDLTVIDGYRGRIRQNRAYEAGFSQKPFPGSKHNHREKGKKCSLALDLGPYVKESQGVEWPDISEPRAIYAKKMGRFYLMAGMVLTLAEKMLIPIRWAGDWDMDGEITDNKFDDLAHFELIEEEL